MLGPGTFIINSGVTVNQNLGGLAGVGSTGVRAVILAKAGGNAINYGNIISANETTTLNSFGLLANSIHNGLPTASATAINYGTISVQNMSADALSAAGTKTVRSFATNYGTINAADRLTGVASDFVVGISALGNGLIINETSGTVNARSKIGSRGSSGMVIGYAPTGYTGEGTFSSNSPQMINRGIINSYNDSHGLYYWGDFRTFGLNQDRINIFDRGHGVYFDNVGAAGAGSEFTNSATGTITTQNINSYGVYMRHLNNLRTDNYGIIETFGTKSHGIVAFSSGSSGSNLPNGQITINGTTAAGIYYSATALSDVNHQWNLGTINIAGSNSFGIATPQSVFRNDGTINISGASSYGMLAGGTYNLIVDNTIPNNAYLGALTPLSSAQGAIQTAKNYGVINAYAALTTGLAAQGVGSQGINIQGAIINAANTGIGLLARLGASVENEGLITANANGLGMLIEANSSGSNLGEVNALNSIGVSVTSGLFTNRGVVRSNLVGILGTNGTVINSSGLLSAPLAVQFISGNNQLNLLNGSVTQGTLLMGAGADETTVFSEADISGVSLFYGGTGASTLTFDGYQGQANTITSWQRVQSINGAHLQLEGTETHSADLFYIDSQSTLGFLSQAGTLMGNVQNEGTLDYSSGNGTGSYEILGNLSNSGLVRLANFTRTAGNHFKVVGNYIGENGSIFLNTYLGRDNSPSDLLIIDGGSATGSTALFINNVSGSGAFTLGNGILVVEAINGSTTAPNAFYQGNPIVGGPFEYTLYRSSLDSSGPENWYLRNLCPLGNPECSPEPPVPPVPPVPHYPPVHYRSEIGLYPVLPAMTLLYGQALLDTLHQRVGLGTEINRVWSRVVGLHGERDRLTNRALHSSHYDYNFTFFQAGSDLFAYESSHWGRHHIGLYGAFGQGTGDVKRPFLTLGSNEFNAFTAGGYWTIYSPQDAYIDTVLQTTWYEEARSQSYRLPEVNTQGIGVGVSVEGGYPFKFHQQWTLEPQVQAIYQAINLDTGKDIGATIRFRNNYGVVGRLGLLATHQWDFDENKGIKSLTAWLRPNFWYQFKGNPQAQFSSVYGFVPFQAQLEGATLELNLGTTINLQQNLAVYANGSYGTGLNLHMTSYDGRLGLKVRMS
ncbi:autotransporter domain-containing protein [Legionella saoudiensis]|uniref:autotransporter domain-containing protein n=1 Tax=Legionella saoudiensis TaxID=1750561 RepID=UPI000730A04A|nr:autotransporter domain-containing protein [Legionella saoudiensis]